jgi:LmbE family N-acetylglucosaminyl deacetylase
MNNFWNSKKILVAVAHNDDVEFICGGLLSSFSNYPVNKKPEVGIITFGSRQENTGEKFNSVLKHQENSLEILNINAWPIVNKQYRARFLPDFEDDIRMELNAFKKIFKPDIVISHHVNDPNQDHVSVVEQVKRVFSNKIVLGGEVPNTGFNLEPNLFVGLNKADILTKVRALSCYLNEKDKDYFQEDVLLSLAIIRGAHSSTYQYSEAFCLYRMPC